MKKQQNTHTVEHEATSLTQALAAAVLSIQRRAHALDNPGVVQSLTHALHQLDPEIGFKFWEDALTQTVQEAVLVIQEAARLTQELAYSDHQLGQARLQIADQNHDLATLRHKIEALELELEEARND